MRIGVLTVLAIRNPMLCRPIGFWSRYDSESDARPQDEFDDTDDNHGGQTSHDEAGNEADRDDEDFDDVSTKKSRDVKRYYSRAQQSISPELTVSKKGRVRIPAKIFSPSGSPLMRKPSSSGDRFSFDVDVDSDGNVCTPKRSKHELVKGSPRLAKGAPVWSPRSPIGEESEGEEINRKSEPRVYISPAPNWFVRPPVGADAALVANLISQYHIELGKNKVPELAAAKALEAGGGGGEAAHSPGSPGGPVAMSADAAATADAKPVGSRVGSRAGSRTSGSPGTVDASGPAATPGSADEEMDTGLDTGAENESDTGPDSWLPSTRIRQAVSPIAAASLMVIPHVQRARSDSVTIGLPDDDDPDHDAVRAEAEVQDKQQLELAVENVLSNGTAADFDFTKCRKCQVQYENDEDDLIVCTYCSIVFHGGCEAPLLDWSPSESFCSIMCFDKYKNSAAGIELFKRNMMLTTGHLRKHSACFTNATCDRARNKPTMEFRGWDTPYTIPDFGFHDLKPGQCVSLRAEPHADDPRIEWYAKAGGFLLSSSFFCFFSSFLLSSFFFFCFFFCFFFFFFFF